MTEASVTLTGGVVMPMVGFGTWQIRGPQGYEALRRALAVGYRHIDTATMYGNEAEVGQALRESGLRRAEVFLTTKLPPERAGRARRTLEESLHHLGTEYVDLWLVHWPPRGRAAVSVWPEFLAARDDGLARAVGVSNYRPDQIDDLIRATGEAPAVNQIPWSPWRHDAALLAEHSKRGIVVEGYSPFKGSDLRHPVLAAVAARHGVSPAQVVLRWHVQHGIVVIPKSEHQDRIAANLDVFGFELTDEEMARLDALAR